MKRANEHESRPMAVGPVAAAKLGLGRRLGRRFSSSSNINLFFAGDEEMIFIYLAAGV